MVVEPVLELEPVLVAAAGAGSAAWFVPPPPPLVAPPVSGTTTGCEPLPSWIVVAKVRPAPSVVGISGVSPSVPVMRVFSAVMSVAASAAEVTTICRSLTPSCTPAGSLSPTTGSAESCRSSGTSSEKR